MSDDLRKLKLTKTSADDVVAFLQQRRVRFDPDNDVWDDGFRDHVGRGTVTFCDDLGDPARFAQLYYQLGLTHWIAFSELYRMAMLAVFGADALDEEFDPFAEIDRKIEEARRDAERLRELRANGGALEEIAAILERARSGLEELARIDLHALRRSKRRSTRVHNA